MKQNAFTLAELLISLVVLGVIATFTIPKVLNSQQSSQWSSSAKEAASMVSGAYQQYVFINGKPVSGIDTALPSEYIQYMNYVKVLSTNQTVDLPYTQGTRSCVNSNQCFLLHNGGVLYPTRVDWGVCDTGSTGDANVWYFDPDGKVTGGGATGSGKAVRFLLRVNGGISTDALPIGNICECGACQGGVNPALIPPWFSWD